MEKRKKKDEVEKALSVSSNEWKRSKNLTFF